MKRQPSTRKVATFLERTARRLRRGLVGDLRIIAVLLDKAAAELRKVS